MRRRRKTQEDTELDITSFMEPDDYFGSGLVDQYGI